MTTKEKALEIFSKMFAELYQIPYESAKAHLEIPGIELSSSYFMAKKCALIAVDEILEATNDDWSHYEYWQEIKTEIENL